MEKIKCHIDKQMIKESCFPLFRLIIIAFIVAALLLGLYITLSIINNNWFNVLNIVALVMSVLLIGIALYLLIRINQQINRALQNERTIVYDFLDEGVSYEIYRDERKVKDGQNSYRDFVGYRESKNFVFLLLSDKTFLGVKKDHNLIEFIENKGLRKHK